MTKEVTGPHSYWLLVTSPCRPYHHLQSDISVTSRELKLFSIFKCYVLESTGFFPLFFFFLLLHFLKLKQSRKWQIKQVGALVTSSRKQEQVEVAFQAGVTVSRRQFVSKLLLVWVARAGCKARFSQPIFLCWEHFHNRKRVEEALKIDWTTKNLDGCCTHYKEQAEQVCISKIYLWNSANCKPLQSHNWA